MVASPSLLHRTRWTRHALQASIAAAALWQAPVAVATDITVNTGNVLTIGGLTGPTLAGFNGFTQNGTALIDPGQVSATLTANATDQVGSLWTSVPQTINNADGFMVKFTYTAGGDRLADGTTFTLQNDPAGAAALGLGGAGLGYQNILNSAAYQINLFLDTGSVLNTDGVTGHTGGTAYQNTGTSVNFASGNPIQVTLNYASGFLVESLRDTVTGGVYSNGYALDLNAVLGGNTARIGFTGATGGLAASQTVSDFSFAVGPGNNQVVSGDQLIVNDGGTVIGTSGTLIAPIWTINGGVVAIAGTSVHFNTFTQTGGYVSLGNINVGSGNSFSVLGGRSSLINLMIGAGGTVSLAGGSLSAGAISNSGTFAWTAGNLHITGASGLTLGATTVGLNLLLNGNISLQVDNTTTVPSGAMFTLDGGNFTTGSLSNAGIINLRSGNFVLAQQDLEIGDAGPFGKVLVVGPDLNVTVNQTTHVAPEGTLAVIDGTHYSSFVQNDGTISVIDGNFTAAFQSVSNFNFDAIRSFITFGGGVYQMVNFGTMNLIDTNVYGDLHNTSGSQLRTNGGVVFFGVLSSDAPLVLAGTVELAAQNNDLLAVGGTANLVVHDTASLTADALTLPSLSVDGLVTLRAGASATKLSDLAIAHTGPIFTGTLELNDNKLLLQTTDASDKAAKLSFLAAAVAAGFNSGDWHGAGITSVNAAADAAQSGVGIFDNSVLGLSLIGGQTVNASSLVVAVARLGDANFDGTVDKGDLALVSNNWLTAQNAWTGGNFNYDGSTNTADLALLAANWQDPQPYPLAVVGFANIANTLGTVTLLANTNYAGTTTIAGGTLQIGNGGTLGSLGSGAIINNSHLQFNRGGSLAVSGTITGDGTLIQNGPGTTTLSNYLGTGAISVMAGTLAFAPTAGTRQTSVVLIQSSALSVASGATLDLTNHDLLIHGGNAATIEALIGSSYFFGLWNKPGITSSSAQSNPITTLGIMSGADYNTYSPTPGVFDGVPVANTDIVVKYTYSGDINLDGLVNDDDFGLFSGAYFFTGVGNYALGDLNFDGLVNDDDFGVFSGNYFFTPPTTLADLASPSAALDGSTPVPEPATLLVLGFAGTGLLTRRRRS